MITELSLRTLWQFTPALFAIPLLGVSPCAKEIPVGADPADAGRDAGTCGPVTSDIPDNLIGWYSGTKCIQSEADGGAPRLWMALSGTTAEGCECPTDGGGRECGDRKCAAGETCMTASGDPMCAFFHDIEWNCPDSWEPALEDGYQPSCRQSCGDSECEPDAGASDGDYLWDSGLATDIVYSVEGCPDPSAAASCFMSGPPGTGRADCSCPCEPIAAYICVPSSAPEVLTEAECPGINAGASRVPESDAFCAEDTDCTRHSPGASMGCPASCGCVCYAGLCYRSGFCNAIDCSDAGAGGYTYR